MSESFFGKLKTEMVRHRSFAARAKARRAVIQYGGPAPGIDHAPGWAGQCRP
ncbi:IS3 family transposase [Streptosporangium sp. NPDC001682]